MRRTKSPHRCSSARHLVAGLLIVVSTLLVAATAVAQEDPSLPDLSQSQWNEIHDGEIYVDVVQREDINRGVIVGIVQHDISEVTPLIARCWEYGDWRKALKDTTFIEKHDDNNVVCGGTAKVPFPFSDRDGHFEVYNRTETVEGTRSFVSTFDYIDGTGNLEEMHGYWVAYRYGEDDEHTLVKHVLNVDIGSWIPSRLIRWATGRTLPGTITGMRKKLGDDVSEPLFWNDHDYE